MVIGVGVMAYAGLGMLLSDKVEERFGLVPTEQDKAELEKSIPKMTLVDREKR